jgi:hypothetical protein
MRNNEDCYVKVTTGNPKLPLRGYFFRGQQGACLLNKCIDRDIDRESFTKLPLTKQVYYSQIQLHSPLRADTDSYTGSDSGNFFEELGYFAFIPYLKAVKMLDLVTTSGNSVVTLEPYFAELRQLSQNLGHKFLKKWQEVIAISRIQKRELRQPQLDEGMYNTKIAVVDEENEVETQFGKKNRCVVHFNVDGVEITRRYNKSLRPSSSFYKLVQSLEGIVPDEYDVDKLEGKECRVVIKHTTSDAGDVWENVTDVMKASQRTFEDP